MEVTADVKSFLNNWTWTKGMACTSNWGIHVDEACWQAQDQGDVTGLPRLNTLLVNKWLSFPLLHDPLKIKI